MNLSRMRCNLYSSNDYSNILKSIKMQQALTEAQLRSVSFRSTK